MNLNFWQWLGLVLLIGGVSYLIYEKVTAPPEVDPAAEEEYVVPESTPEPAGEPVATQPA